MSTARRRIGDILVDTGVITHGQLQEALEEQRGTRQRLGDVLIAKGYITHQQFVEVLEFQLGIPQVQIYRQKIDPKVIELITQKLATAHTVLPLRVENNRLVLAMADPLDYFAIDEVRVATGLRVEPMIASREELVRAINRYYGLQDTIDQITQNLQLHNLEDEQVIQDEDSPVVKTVNGIIIQAVTLGASDIHLDPQDGGLRIRYRVDGVMRTERTLPASMQGIIVARIKIMANLNVAERRIPQDGRVELDVEYRKVDVRISTLPTIHGEKVVIRVLDLGSSLTDISRLGFTNRNEEIFRRNVEKANGVVLITGPTGSGKTTTLYSALAHLNNETINVITVEDPVEYHLEGINQVEVNHASGLTFARGLRSILRQDPDVIMLGEIRDTDTAEIAIRAAMTGHLVLSTLHTNSAVGTMSRLIDMGVEPFLIASSINCVVAQRLLRRICPHCKTTYEPSFEESELLARYGVTLQQLSRGEGCGECGRTGYKGRMAVHEVLEVNDELRALIMTRQPDSVYQDYARKRGLITMQEDGLAKAAAGQTTLAEVFRVLGQSE